MQDDDYRYADSARFIPAAGRIYKGSCRSPRPPQPSLFASLSPHPVPESHFTLATLAARNGPYSSADLPLPDPQ